MSEMVVEMASKAERLRAGIQNTIDDLVGVPCCFWACPGPDVEYTPMATCNICATVIELRELLATTE